jgi:transposase
VIRFFTLKGLKARAIQAELGSVYGTEAVALPRVRKWRRRFHQRGTDLFDDLRSAGPLTNDLAGELGSILEEKPSSSCKVLCRHFRIGEETACGAFMTSLA